ncbi:hypothetical protein Daura_32105 [Dactylosporangium aurantiacum]|uniref:Uncharacterized protein n=1 Tax=Dactylosporangium aurantiacum TaxID=35754 RepID=A0A9Q9ICB1_9ACTN|nr:hypothetical protein [Dactylosporangium aurantiacum]MDG6107083.1 hypothetical protein [Dactylosporangium aurantiacum]UWZ51382.1 hypothetical protein Daura_32105 [Dactylosporangium aurantiacum]
MSDLYIRVIPTDPRWQPTAEAAAAAARYVAGLFAGPGDHAEAVEPVFYERVTLIDPGEHMQDVGCPRCGTALGLDWLWDLLRAANGGRLAGVPSVDTLDVTVPCCGAALTLPQLRFGAEVGFARFEVSVMNWTRDTWELSADELAATGAILGHPVTQVHAHY